MRFDKRVLEDKHTMEDYGFDTDMVFEYVPKLSGAAKVIEKIIKTKSTVTTVVQDLDRKSVV